MAFARFTAETARRWPDRPAVVSHLRTSTWREFADRAAREAHGLRALDLNPGDRVAILSQLSAEQASFLVAVSWAGLTPVPINSRLSYEERLQICADADVHAIASDDDMLESAVQIATALGVPLRIGIGDTTPAGGVGRSALDHGDVLEFADAEDTQPAAIIYTGGSTGLPKGVVLPHGALAVEGRSMRDYVGYDHETVYLHSMTLFHVAGLAQFLGVTLGGGAHVFAPGAGVAAAFPAMRELGVNALCGAPTSIAMMLDAPSEDVTLLKGLRSFGYGSAPIGEALLKRALEAMPKTRFVQFFGQTETCGAVTALAAKNHILEGPESGKLATVGKALPPFEIAIADLDGRLLSAGETGEIMVRAPGAVSLGYWRKPELTEALFRDEWVRTGDVGRLDPDGFLTVVDRIKDMVISGGENIYTVEVEAVLARHDAVDACAVIGLPHPVWGEAVVGVVALRPGQTETPEALIAYCRERLSAYKCPKAVIIRQAPFPLSSVGKILKHELRREFAGLWNQT